jgi:DNA invertase Pin-like site-specific DNA recombinase
VPAFPIPEGLPHHPQISPIPDCPGGSTGTSRPFASLRAKGAPLRGGSLLWTTWTIRSAEAQHGHLTTLQQIATDLERHRHPALHDALEYARSGDTLVVWKLDRLARSMKQLIETVEKLRVRGIGFRSLTEALDTTTAQGLLVFHMFSALAEFERSLIRERTRAGLAAARRIGRTGGRPPKLTDDDLEAARALLANPDIGVTQIAHRLGVSPATLYRYLPAARTANTPSV